MVGKDARYVYLRFRRVSVHERKHTGIRASRIVCVRFAVVRNANAARNLDITIVRSIRMLRGNLYCRF